MLAPPHYDLRPPSSTSDWDAYHAIRRDVLFERRGHFGTYNPNHPDESRPGHQPLVLWVDGEIVGVIRLDVSPPQVTFRLVAIRDDRQRQGHGRALIRLAAEFARNAGCEEALVHSAPDAVAFYRRCGFVERLPADAVAETVLMAAQLHSPGQ